MENQKIQQLIRLASIADNNGDYRIADKIFNKVAQIKLPPRFNETEMAISPGNVFKPKNLETFLTSVASKIEKFVAEQKRLQSLLDQYAKIKDLQIATHSVHDPAVPGVQGAPATAKQFIKMTDQDLSDALTAYKTKKKFLEDAEQELEIELSKPAKDQAEIDKLRLEISKLQKFINDNRYREIFGDDPANPKNTIPYAALVAKLKTVTDEINRELPDPNQIEDLSKVFMSEQNAMGRLTAFFNKINTSKANEILDKFKLEEDLKGKGLWARFWAKRGAGWEKTKDRIISIKNTFIQIGAERKAISDYNVKGKLPPEAIKAYFRAFYKQESQDFGRTFTNLINALDKELVFEFIKQRDKYRLDNKLKRQLNDKELEAIVEKVRLEVGRGTVGALVTGLFDAMTKNFKVLKDAAIVELQKDSKALTSPNILARMIRLDGKFMKNTGISHEFAYKLIENENISIEEFLKSQGESVIANIKNEKRNAILLTLTTSGILGGGALTVYLRRRAEEEAYAKNLKGRLNIKTDKQSIDKDINDVLGGP